MKEFMPNTHIKGEDARAYAAGELSFDQIAEDRGPRFESTLDMYMSQIPAYGRQPSHERKLTKAQQAALRSKNAGSIEFERQLVAQNVSGLKDAQDEEYMFAEGTLDHGYALRRDTRT